MNQTGQASVPAPSFPSSPQTKEGVQPDAGRSTVGQHRDPAQHPLPAGYLFSSPGGHFTYRVIGPCCQLFDREELPWPCCRIQWRSKEPSWRRIGRRFVADLAAKRCPSYAVEILNQEYSQDPFVLTLYWVKLTPEQREWWYSKIRQQSSD